MLKKRVAASLLTGVLMACEATPSEEQAHVLVLRPVIASPLTEAQLQATTDELLRYLRAMGLSAEAMVLAEVPEKALAASVVIALEAQELGVEAPRLWVADALDPDYPEHDDRFVLHTLKRLNQPWVVLDANTALGSRYAIYELLRRLGARFYHPEDEWIPKLNLEDLRHRITRPTALGEGPVFTPDYVHRSFTFHSAHPLEHLETFSDARHPLTEAEHVTDWIIKSRGDVFRGPGRGVAPIDARRQREAELEDLRLSRGLRRTISVQLHNRQQGERPDIDLESPIPVETQIRELLQTQLQAIPDAYGLNLHFGPTELTTTPDLETVELLNLTGRLARDLKPNLKVEINNHTTGAQPVEHYGDLGCPSGTNSQGVADYYDLSFHTDPELGVRVHTVMFHPLEGPAGVYHQPSFAHKLCLIAKGSEQGRPLTYFPESAYWLSWDNAVPVYLPLYMATRQRDFELIHPLTLKEGGSVMAHRLFNSGQEWGYWQTDYAVGLWHWNSTIPLRSVLAELADPFCASLEDACEIKTRFIEGLEQLMALQWAHFLDKPDFQGRPGGLYTMFAGEDPADELGAASGLEFRPVRLSFRALAALSEAERQRFQSTDLKDLETLESAHQTLHDQLLALRAEVPESGLRYLDEVLTGLEINALRARHTRLLYEVVLAFKRQATPQVEALLGETHQVLARVESLIADQESRYRYPPTQTHGGGLTPESAVANGTTYPYRVHTKTHLMTYWHSRQIQVERLVAGEEVNPLALNLKPVFAESEAQLTVEWPQLAQASGEISFTPLNGGAGFTWPWGHSGANLPEGIFAVSALIESEGTLIAPKGAVVRGTLQATVKGKDFQLVEPEAELARNVLASLLPAIQIAWDGAKGLAWAVVAEGLEALSFDQALALSLHEAEGGFLESIRFDSSLGIPDPSTGAIATTIRMVDAKLRFTSTISFTSGDAFELEGKLSLADLVQALIKLAGFDEGGALMLLAELLSFDAAQPPELLPFKALLTLTRD